MTSADGPDLVGQARWRALQATIDELAGQGLDELLAQAHADAQARVRAILADAMAAAMLSAAADRQSPARGAGAMGLYVYGIVSTDQAADVPGMPGIEAAHAVSTLEAGDLAAVVSAVPLDEFDEEHLREHLGDMTWVERVARRHEEVLEATADAVTVIPMRMCSIFREAAGVRGMLEREAVAMRRALQDLRGKAEWAVKAFRVPVTAAAQADDAPQTGTGYLERQAQARQARERAGAEGSARCEAIHAELSGLSARSIVLAPQRPEVSGHRGDMLLNGAYLVAGERLDAFRAAVERLSSEPASDGLELRLTGPWPAYNFVPDAVGSPA